MIGGWALMVAVIGKNVGDRTSRFLKSEMKRAGLTYSEVAGLLEEHGFKETEASITSKLARGTFSATFLLAVALVLGVDKIDVRALCE